MTSANTIKECFNVILSGDKEESRLAARQVRKILYSTNKPDKNMFKDIGTIINNAPAEYDKITDIWRQEYFVRAISVIYYLHGNKKPSDFLFPWLFQLLQHQSGIIRYAAVRMFTDELGPLTAHIRVPEYKISKSKAEEYNNILYSLFISLGQLIIKLWEPKYKKYKYIDSLPPGPYKSAQMVMAVLEDYCQPQFFDKLKRNQYTMFN